MPLAAPLFTASLTALRALPLALVQTALHAAPGRAARCVTRQARQALRQAPGLATAHAQRLARRAAWLALLGLLTALPMRAWGQAANPTAPVAESPYFFVRGAQPGVDALPLKRTDVRVDVAGVVAEVVVTQHYRNEGAAPIEASYIFPGGTGAAVHGL
ncbi:MAG: VIT domain-containing protein, partial [Comamonadaceae bacterium]|nr:VIT domain-containing protein [Comamonadaceae bacterium]